MLTNSIQSIIPELTAESNPQGETGKQQAVSLVSGIERENPSVFVADSDTSLTKAIGQLQNGLDHPFLQLGKL